MLKSPRKSMNVDYIKNIIPGIFLCIVVMLIGIYGAELIGFYLMKSGFISSENKTPISGIFIAILTGMIFRNTIGLFDIFSAGISFCMKYALRAGIILLGLRMSLLEVFRIGAIGIPLIVICIFFSLFITLFLTKKMKLPFRLGTLTACGTSICGVTAIMAVSPLIKAKENEISYAVANITIFGLTGMIFYPYLANLFFTNDPIKIGMFLGTAIHDTAQVTGAALIYQQIYNLDKVIDIATVTKLTRNLFLILIIPLISYLFYKFSVNNMQQLETEKVELPKWYSFIPLFVIGFLLLVFLRTIGDFTLIHTEAAFGFLEKGAWEKFHKNTGNFGMTYLLGIAMAGVGLSTNFKTLKGIGLKPFYVGFVAALTVGLVSVIVISLIGGVL